MCWSAGQAAGASAPGTSTYSSLPGLNLAELEALAAPHLPPQAAKAYLHLRLLADQHPLQASQRALARDLRTSQTTIWRALRDLESAGLLTRARASRRRPARLELPGRLWCEPSAAPPLNHSASWSAPAGGPFVTVLAALDGQERRAPAGAVNHSGPDPRITRSAGGIRTYDDTPHTTAPSLNHSGAAARITRSSDEERIYDDSRAVRASRAAPSDSPSESLGVQNESLPIPPHTCEEENNSHVAPFPDPAAARGVGGAAEEALKGRAEGAVDFRRAVDLLLAVPGWMSRTKDPARKEKTEGLLRVYTRRWPASTVELWIRISESEELRHEVSNRPGWLRQIIDGYGRRNWFPRTAGGRSILWQEALLRGAYESALVYLRRRAGYRADERLAGERKQGQEAMDALRGMAAQDPELGGLLASCVAAFGNPGDLDEVDRDGPRRGGAGAVASALPRGALAPPRGAGGDLDGASRDRRGVGRDLEHAGGEASRRGAA